MSMVRAAFEAPDDIVRIFVLCHGCLQELMLNPDLPRRWVKDFSGPGGECELCQTEIRRMALNEQ